MMKTRLSRIITLVAWCLIATNAYSKDVHDLLLVGANIINVETGEVTPEGILAIDNDEITFVGPASATGDHEGRRQVDLSGKYMIPGLWDMHIHLEGKDLVEDNKALLPLYIAFGITTVRDMASDLGEQVLAWRDEIDQGTLFGPQIFTAGRKLEGIDSVWR